MAAVTPRIPWFNLFIAADTVITASSEDAAHPITYLLDPLLTRRSRSALGWNIVTGVNDKIDITEGVSGDATATLTAGNYASGVDMAAHVQTQVDAAATDNTWTCTYSTSTRKFTIGHNNVQTGALEWSTGTNTLTSAGEDLGFDTSADDTGASSYPGDDACRHSREWVKFDLGSAMALLAGLFTGHNLGTGGTVTLQGNATDAFTAPSFSQTVTGTNKLRGINFASTSLRWWRVLIDDIDNADGFSEVGVIFGGSYDAPTRKPAQRHTEIYDDLSRFSEADQGAVFQTKRSTRRRFELVFRSIGLTQKQELEAIDDDRGIGGAFFVSLDPQNDLVGTTKYVTLDESITFRNLTAPGAESAWTWQASLSLLELIQ